MALKFGRKSVNKEVHPHHQHTDLCCNNLPGIPGYSDWWYQAYDATNGSRMRASDISFTRAEEMLAKSGVKTKWDNVQKLATAS